MNLCNANSTRPLISISLNKNSNYCYIPRSSKHTDTCKWSGRVFWSCSLFGTNHYNTSNSIIRTLELTLLVSALERCDMWASRGSRIGQGWFLLCSQGRNFTNYIPLPSFDGYYGAEKAIWEILSGNILLSSKPYSGRSKTPSDLTLQKSHLSKNSVYCSVMWFQKF